MMIQTIADGHLKITLNRSETEKIFGINGISLSSQRAQTAINKLFERAAQKSKFKPVSKKLLVELFFKKSGGCSICFIDTGYNSADNSVVLEFENDDDMLAAFSLLNRFNKKIIKRQIYSYGDKYRIYLLCAGGINEIILSIKEYARGVYVSEIEKAKTKEYGKLIWDNGL